MSGCTDSSVPVWMVVGGPDNLCVPLNLEGSHSTLLPLLKVIWLRLLLPMVMDMEIVVLLGKRHRVVVGSVRPSV